MATRRFSAIWTIAAALALSLFVGAARAEQRHASPSLSAEYAQVDGSAPFYALFRLDLEKNWHSYWKNPGDSGLETTIEWKLPEGFTASELIWQPPHRMPLGPLTNYGYENSAYYLTKITPPPSLPRGAPITLTVKANWLVCRDVCVPENAAKTLTIDVGDASLPSSDKKLIDRLRDSANPPPLDLEGANIDNGGVELLLSGPNVPQKPGDAYFFPEDGGLIDHAAAQSFSYKNGKLRLRMARGPGEAPTRVVGFLEATAAGATAHYRVDGDVRPIASSKDAPSPAASPSAKASGVDDFIPAVALAFLGGIILNAMPCVFPILSLKALAIAKKSAKERRVVRLYGLAYMAGCMTFFALIGGMLIALRHAGQEIGWGYQMQSPLFVAMLATLIFGVGLNLIGFFPVNVGLTLGAGKGKESFLSVFATGALAVLVATPCTAPFMATALGAALSFPEAQAVGVFLALGFGLSFPYLLIAFVPGALALLPRPGAWMETFKEALAFPMFLTSVWLAWVLAHQAGVDGAAWWGISVVALCFVVWVRRRVAKGAPALILAALGAIAFAYPFFRIPSAKENDARESLTSVPYDEATLAETLAEGRPAFVYATASWCITCKVNERTLDSARVAAAFADRNVAVFKADWTNADPAITRYLEIFGRNGVPLYVYYPQAQDEGETPKPRVLPQLLTPSSLLEAMEE
ncbi:MAG: thioredoxin family protein [Rickettsiales bacterium]